MDINDLRELDLTSQQLQFVVDSILRGPTSVYSGWVNDEPDIFYTGNGDLKIQIDYNRAIDLFKIQTW